MQNKLQKKYKDTIVPELQKELGLKNAASVPSLDKVVISTCMGLDAKDASYAELVEKNLREISAQAPVRTVARKSVSNFKTRKGMFLGFKVSLRGKRMYDFVYRLVNLTMPRIRDFKGLSVKGVDKQGNLTVGFKDQVSFLELSPEAVERLHGLEITLVSTAENKYEGALLFKHLGFPFIDFNKLKKIRL